MKRALHITAIIALVTIVGLIVYLKTISEGKSIYISTGFADGIIAKVDGEDILESEVKVLLADAKMEYEEMFGEDIWSEKIGEQTFDQYVIDTIKARITRQKCMQVMAEKRGIVLSSVEERNVISAAQEYIDSLGKEQMKALGVDKTDMEQMFKEAVIADRIFNDMTLEVDTEVSEDEARVISVQYIKTSDRASAAKILNRIREGEGFLTLVKENNAYEYEYLLRRGEVESVFEDAAFALATGEISNVVQATTGYYIILCVNDYDKAKTASNKEQIISNRKLEAFNSVFEQYEAEKYAEYDEEEWDGLDVKSMPAFETGFNKIYEKYFK